MKQVNQRNNSDKSDNGRGVGRGREAWQCYLRRGRDKVKGERVLERIVSGRFEVSLVVGEFGSR